MSRRSHRLFPFLVFACVSSVLAACGPRRVALPSGDGTPSPEAVTAYDDAVKECRGWRTMEVTLGLSGRAGATRLRGSIDAGFEAPEKVRLEMRAPIGRAIFILAAAGPDAILYLPRDNQVLRGARAADVVEALVGLPVSGAELRSIVSGCGFGAGQAANGRAYEGSWLAVEAGGAVNYLQQVEGRWRVAAATRRGLTVHYSEFAAGRATVIRLQEPRSQADVTARLSDVNINVTLQPAVFDVDVPAGAEPVTLEELRRAGPLGRQ